MKEFIKHGENEVNWMYATFSQKPMTELTNVLKRQKEAAEKCYICFKRLSFENREVRDNCYYTDLFREAVHIPNK